MEFDVVVVGASTSGLYASQLLAEAGLRVAVFERESEHQPARRTLIVTPAFGQALNSGIPEQVELHRSSLMRVAAAGSVCEVRFRRPDPIIERGEMTRRLAEAAVAAGAQIHYGYRFSGFDRDAIRFSVRQRRAVAGPESSEGDCPPQFCSSSKSESLCASPVGDGQSIAATVLVRAQRAVIGADGVLSDVGPAAKIPRPPSVPILQAEVALPAGWDPDVTQVWFDADTTQYFFWLIPESSSRGVVGLIGEPRTQMRVLLESFLKERGLKAIAFQGSQVAMHHPLLRPWGKVGGLPVLLVGDAAGQVKVTTVGGAVTGFAGTRAAVRSILNGTSYRKEMRALKRELDVHWCIRWVLGGLDTRGYAELLRVINGPVQEFLARYNRDEMAPVIWRLPLIQPRLVWIGLRCLLKKRNRGRGG